jgi:putative ABC transport system permease protein
MLNLPNIKLAFANLAATKLRTLLAMLGILVGTASVVAMVSTGQMATAQALAQFKVLGTDMMAISLYSEGGGDNSNSSATKSLDAKAATETQTASKQIEMVAPYTLLYAPIIYQGNTINGNIIGATQNLANVVRIKMAQGRFVSDLDRFEPYCIIGSQIYDTIKTYNPQPLGSQIRLGDNIYTIVGVASNWPENAFFYQDLNNAIIVPILTSSLLSKYASIDNIVMRLKPNSDINQVQTDLTRYLNNIAPDKKIFFRSAKELIKSMAAQHQIFTLLLGAIGGISLLVGGIGVMNIMLVSVLERRREIGIRLALGARRKEIQWMFLNEAVLLSLVGGIIGILLGIIVSFIIAEFAHWVFTIFFLPPFIGFVVSVLVGVFFGYYPAYQAAKLDPIQTLRSE